MTIQIALVSACTLVFMVLPVVALAVAAGAPVCHRVLPWTFTVLTPHP